MGFMGRVKSAAESTQGATYPSAPFGEGEDVTVKVDPADRDVAMMFGKA